MFYTRSQTRNRMVRDGSGGLIGLMPISVTQDMSYRNGGLSTFGYSTDVNSEQQVDKALDNYPSYISRVFRNLILSFSKGVWRSRR